MSEGEKTIVALLAGILLAVLGLGVLVVVTGYQLRETVKEEVRQAVPFRKEKP